MAEVMTPEKLQFFNEMEAQRVALTYADVGLETFPDPDSDPLEDLPAELDLTTRFTRNIGLKLPFVSAAMNTVTEADMAIALARAGGIGVIHNAMTIDQQKEQVMKVKYAISGRIDNPISVGADQTLQSVRDTIDNRGFHFETFPVVDSEGRLEGVLTGQSFEYAASLDQQVGSVMVKAAELTRADSNTTLSDAYHIMKDAKINMLPLTNPGTNILTGLYLWKDLKRLIEQNASGNGGLVMNLDADNRLRVAIAVRTDPSLAVETVTELRRYIDVVVLDSADGDSSFGFKTLVALKENFSDLDVVAGNVDNGISARMLAERDADAIKIGRGPGAICTTPNKTGTGKPQLTAVNQAYRAIAEKFDIPVIADGGIVHEGDILKAIAAGASSVMMGRMFAGTDEAPGEVIMEKGVPTKPYNGMGAAINILASGRYYATEGEQPASEGVEASVPVTGPVVSVIKLLREYLIKGLRDSKRPSLDEHRRRTQLYRKTEQGQLAAGAHNVQVKGSR